ncbi:MAG TPA: hypothetical protein VGT44_15120, partial [Ktedonobacteraceae bacterium]|nr:hypothetical protein [Ktedonobacteraceae bacterium]
MMTMTVQHVTYIPRFLPYEDFWALAERFCARRHHSKKSAAKQFQTLLCVLETFHQDHLAAMTTSGRALEELQEADLWFEVIWSALAHRAQYFCCESTFRMTLPRLIDAGYVRQRYVKRDGGLVLAYATYKEA